MLHITAAQLRVLTGVPAAIHQFPMRSWLHQGCTMLLLLLPHLMPVSTMDCSVFSSGVTTGGCTTGRLKALLTRNTLKRPEILAVAAC
jgi:hypothetical protein